MKADEAKNTIDSAHPHPDAADRLTEEEKKALELSGLVEHVDGPVRSDMANEAQALEGSSSSATAEP